MDYSEIDEEEKKRRKEQSVIWRTKRKNSTIFMFATTIVEILVSLAAILILFCVSAFFIFRVFHAGDTKAGAIIFEVLTVVSFIGGMIIGYFLYKLCARWAIKQFKLEDKLSDDVLMHYKKLSKEELEQLKLQKMRR